MIFQSAIATYSEFLSVALEDPIEKAGKEGLGFLLDCFTKLIEHYDEFTPERKYWREETEDALVKYLNREWKGYRDAESRPIIEHIHNALKKDDETYKEVEAWAKQHNQVVNPYSLFSHAEKSVRAEKTKTQGYPQIFENSLQELLTEMNKTAKEALWNSSEFKEMHDALKRCLPGDKLKDPEAIRSKLGILNTAAEYYLSQKSLDPFTQRGKERVALARKILNVSFDLYQDYDMTIEAETPAFKRKIVPKESTIGEFTSQVNAARDRTLAFLEKADNPDQLLQDEQFLISLSELESLRMHRQLFEEGKLSLGAAKQIITGFEDRENQKKRKIYKKDNENVKIKINLRNALGVYEKLSPALLQIETKEQLLALINRKEPVLRKKENGDWVSPEQGELEAFFQNIKPVTMQQGPGQGESKAEEKMIPLLEIEPEEVLLPQQNVIDQDAQDAQEEREFLNMLESLPKEEEELFRGGNPILMDENPILIDEVREEEEWKIDSTELQMDKNEDFAAGAFASEGRLEDIQLLDDDLPFMTAKKFYKDEKDEMNRLSEKSKKENNEQKDRPAVLKQDKIVDVVNSLPAIIQEQKKALLLELPEEGKYADSVSFINTFAYLDFLKMVEVEVKSDSVPKGGYKEFSDLPQKVKDFFQQEDHTETLLTLRIRAQSHLEGIGSTEELKEVINSPQPALAERKSSKSLYSRRNSDEKQQLMENEGKNIEKRGSAHKLG